MRGLSPTPRKLGSPNWPRLNWDTLSRQVRSRRSVGTLAILAVVLAFYVWTADSGNHPIRFGSNLGDHYNQLTDAFLHGRASLLPPPPPGLLALKDPYDPNANAAYRLAGYHDLSLYQGRLYLYWGPTPVVTLYLPWRLLPFGDMPEALAAVIFAFAGLVFSLLLLGFLVRRYLPESPTWMWLLGVVALAFGNVAPFLLRRPTVYEVAIAAGYCFAMAALYFLLSGALRERPSLARLAIGSACVGLAAGARPPQILVALAIPVLLFALIRSGRAATRRERLSLAAAALGPVAVCGVLLLIYNYVRFDSFTEFGQRYQLAGVEVTKKTMFDPAYIPPGLYYYLLAPVRWALNFPYAHLPPPPTLGGPSGYDGVELTGGLLTNMPFLLVLIALPLLIRRRLLASREMSYIVGGLAVLGLILAAFVSWTLWGATMRYEMDFATLFVVAAILVWLSLRRVVGPPRWRRRLVAIGAIALLTYGVIVSAAISITGYDNSLLIQNPGTFHSLERFFSPLPTLATMIGGSPGISDVSSAAGVASPHINYGTGDASGSSFFIGTEPAVVTVISPASQTVILRADLTHGPGLPPRRFALIHASSGSAQTAVPVRGVRADIPVRVKWGLNRVLLSVSSQPAPPAVSSPASQLVRVGRITVGT